MLHYSPKKHGFTLIEIMIVVAIIGILAGIMVPNFMKARAEANLAACQSNMKAIATAVHTYSIRHRLDSNFRMDMLVDEGYIKAIPKCPSGGTYNVPSSTNSDKTVIFNRVVCIGQVHKAAGITGRFYTYGIYNGKFSDNDADFNVF